MRVYLIGGPKGGSRRLLEKGGKIVRGVRSKAHWYIGKKDATFDQGLGLGSRTPDERKGATNTDSGGKRSCRETLFEGQCSVDTGPRDFANGTLKKESDFKGGGVEERIVARELLTSTRLPYWSLG